jgi:glycosyltransferase involved in cell wall biosynthesis
MRYAKMLSQYLQVPHVIHAHYTIGEWLGTGILKDIQKAKHLFTVSEFVRQNALLCGVTYENVHTIPNTIDFKGFPDVEDPKQLLAEFGWQENNRIILAVGRLDPGKGHDDLLRAFADVVRQVPEARVLICGTPSSNHGYEQKLKQIAQELNIASFVHFAGYRTDVPKLVQCADLFCLPSIMEPFGLVYLEAMAAKLPVVAYYSGGVPEIVLHERTGLLSYPDDLPALANNLMTLLKDPDCAAKLGQAGFERAVQEFNPDKISAHWFALLQRFFPNF